MNNIFTNNNNIIINIKNNIKKFNSKHYYNNSFNYPNIRNSNTNNTIYIRKNSKTKNNT